MAQLNDLLVLGKSNFLGSVDIYGNAASIPLRVRGIVGSSGAGVTDDLYLQYGANKVIRLGDEGAYTISADGGTYSGTANIAKKLENSKTFQTDLGSTATGSFNGESNVTLGVTGTLPVANGGTGATSFTSGRALIGSGTGAVTTRAITNNTSKTAVTGSTNLITANTLYYHSGNSNITTVGTITSGTWNGTTIAVANGGTGATTASNACTNLGAVKKSGDTMTGDLIVQRNSAIIKTANADGENSVGLYTSTNRGVYDFTSSHWLIYKNVEKDTICVPRDLYINGELYRNGLASTRVFETLMPYGTAVAEEADLNTTIYLAVGNYYCSQNAKAEKLTNCPTAYAFMMQVLSPLSTTIDNETTKTWNYRLRKLQTYQGEQYIQYCYAGATATEWTYGPWQKMINTSHLVTTSVNGLMLSTDKKKLNYTNIAYGTCDTAAGIAEKVVVLSVDTNWSLTVGSIITVKFAVTNTAESPKLNVNGTGAIPIWYNASEYTSGGSYGGYEGRHITYQYNGTHWVFVSWSYDSNSDTKVQQTAAITTDANYPVLLGYSTGTSSVTNTVKKSSTLKYNPGTQTLTAPTFKGALDGTAAKATADASGNTITSTYATKTALSKKPGAKVEGESVTYSSQHSGNGVSVGTANLTATAGAGAEVFNDGGCKAIGSFSHAEGYGTLSLGHQSHAEGMNTKAIGDYSHASGYGTYAQGDNSTASGYYTFAGHSQTVVGRYNKYVTGYASNYADAGTSATAAGLFVVGIGTSSDPANGFRVAPSGNCYAGKATLNQGADYAEYFEWQDSNSKNEDRRGRFVTLCDDKIRYATSSDDYILGVVSATPSAVGDVQSESWKNKYITDIFGNTIYEYVDVPEHTDENGEIIRAHVEQRKALNPNYDPSIKYTSRELRSEWDAVGLVGKLVVVDDGTCQPNGYCYPGVDGIATASVEKTNFRVMERLDDTHIRIFIK